jgi:hypothetical protein
MYPVYRSRGDFCFGKPIGKNTLYYFLGKRAMFGLSDGISV